MRLCQSPPSANNVRTLTFEYLVFVPVGAHRDVPSLDGLIKSGHDEWREVSLVGANLRVRPPTYWDRHMGLPLHDDRNLGGQRVDQQ